MPGCLAIGGHEAAAEVYMSLGRFSTMPMIRMCTLIFKIQSLSHVCGWHPWVLRAKVNSVRSGAAARQFLLHHRSWPTYVEGSTDGSEKFDSESFVDVVLLSTGCAGVIDQPGDYMNNVLWDHEVQRLRGSSCMFVVRLNDN